MLCVFNDWTLVIHRLFKKSSAVVCVYRGGTYGVSIRLTASMEHPPG